MYQFLKDPSTGVARIDIVQRVEDKAFIPADPKNIDYQAYQLWLAAGNTPLAADE